MKEDLTTGQVAKLCSVSPRTVSKWTDEGILSYWRVPGSKDRRIPATALYNFMQKHGMPSERLKAELFIYVLVLSPSDEKVQSIFASIQALNYFNVSKATTSFAAGLLISQRMPNIIITDGAIDTEDQLKDVLKLDMDDPTLIDRLMAYSREGRVA